MSPLNTPFSLPLSLLPKQKHTQIQIEEQRRSFIIIVTIANINMSCSVAVPTSPVFSFYNNNNNVNSSTAEPLMLSLPIPSTTPSCSSLSPPSSPLLKRKRPAKIDIPVASIAFAVSPTAAPSPARDAFEVDGPGFSVFCKRGRRHHMEDCFSAAVDLHGQPKQVIIKNMKFSSFFFLLLEFWL